ncbi:MAG: nickel-dependent lactate racemase [Desulfarculus sp.]|nr:nickel-dependent lactate racemase [Desulfarculus sp.]
MSATCSVELPCGQQWLQVRLPGHARHLRTRPAPALADPLAAARAALASPIGCPPLAELAQGRRDACLVISDATRPVPNQVLLPPILETLEAAGLAPGRITIMVATGMHPPMDAPALEAMLGRAITRRYQVVNHDCRQGNVLVERIEGQAIEINARFLAAGLKILTGLIEPHTFAGFSGGGKAVLPGLASLETMRFLHSYDLVANPRLATGRLEGNPFQEHITRVVGRLGVDFMVNAVIGQDRRPTGVFAGHWLMAHRAGCQACRGQAMVSLERPADLVITSGGGHPLDHTFFQANKGLLTARGLARPGATVLMVAGCQGGLGEAEFRRILEENPTPAAFAARHGQGGRFVKDQWAAQRFFQAKEHFERLHLYAPGLPAADFALLGMAPVQDLQGALDSLCAQAGQVVAIPQGPYLAGSLGPAY